LDNGIDTQTAEHWAVWKSVVVGALTFVWPMLLNMMLMR